jgi:dihydrofolate reductase
MSDSTIRNPKSEIRDLSIIAAVSENNVIGRDGGLPWRLSADLARFKRLTMGHAIIMGRRTWESIGRPLPGRTSIVISRQSNWRTEGASVAGSLDAALEVARQSDVDQSEVFVIGGAAVYALALPRAERLYLTRVHADVEGDVEFPAVDWNAWQLCEESHHAADERNDFAHTFQVWLRKA